MSETTAATVALTVLDPSSPSSVNPALARCLSAYKQAFKAARDRGKGKVFSELDGEEAYRLAMPPLCGGETIRDFIACTTQGMIIGAFDGAAGARLLYAAQVAHSTLRNQSEPPKLAAE